MVPSFFNIGTMGVAQSDTLIREIIYSAYKWSSSAVTHCCIANGTGRALLNLGVAPSFRKIFTLLCFKVPRLSWNKVV